SLILVIGVSGASVDIGMAPLKGMALSTVIAVVLGVFFYGIDWWGGRCDKGKCGRGTSSRSEQEK
ncbi:MAG: hypothetical protein Q7T80_03390, partial [Methanoregula sp.]|nr:hypothetical protein [Methanoregula sp.]